MRHPTRYILSVALLLSGCATQQYAPSPLEPQQRAVDYRARSLDDAGLRAYLVAQGYPQQALPIKRWGLHELTLTAFYFHPRLETMRAQAKAAEAAVITAGRRPNPGIAVGAEHHSDTAGGVSPWMLGFNLDIPVETAGKRDIRLKRAAALSEAARLDIGQTAWEIRSALRARMLEYAAAKETSGLLAREAQAQQEIVAMLERRLAAGMVSELELGQARLQLQDLRLRLAAQEARLPELRAAIAGACGLSVDAFAGATLDTAEVEQTPAWEQLPAAEVQQAALLNRLDIRAGLARYAATEAALQLEIARQYPDFTFSPGYAYDQGDRLWTLGVSLLLGLLDRNEGPIAEAKAQRAVEAARFHALQAQVIGEQEQALAGYRAALAAQAQAEQLLARQRGHERQIRGLFEAGHADRLELTQAVRQTLAAQHGAIQAALRARRALGLIEDAVQRPLASGLELKLP